MSVILRSPRFSCSIPAVERSGTTVDFGCCLPRLFRLRFGPCKTYTIVSPEMVPYFRDTLLQARGTAPHSDENRAPSYQAFLIVMTVLVVIAIVVRFWSRALAAPEGRLVSRYWWDDWLALAAVVSSSLSTLRDGGKVCMQNRKEGYMWESQDIAGYFALVRCRQSVSLT